MAGYWRALFVFLWTETKSRSIKMQKKERGYNRRQNELRHFAQNWAFGGERGGVRILLFFKVTLFKYNVSTILSPIV